MKKIELLNGLMKKLLAAFMMVTVLEGMVRVEDAYSATRITNVSWDSSLKAIHVTLDAWPATFGKWTMYVDGVKVPMEGGVGNPVIRPDAPLDQPPTGLFIGTDPWVTGLSEVDFPCCGTIQFDIPGEGLINKYKFNVVDSGCQTASKKQCPSVRAKHRGDLVTGGTETKIKDVSEKGYANEDYVMKAVKELILAILTSDHERISDLSRYEGFSSSKRHIIDKLVKSYHKVGHYSCVEIEPISLEVDPDLEEARVAVRVHFSIAKTLDSVGITPTRIETWEFTNKSGDWLIILPK